MLNDIKIALRGIVRSPSFAIAVILTLALGIGANTAIFSVVDQVLLRPLPYPNGDQLVIPYETLQFNNRNLDSPTNNVSPANWLDWQRANHTLQALAAWRDVIGGVTLSGNREPIQLKAQQVSWEFFPILGVQPLLGRVITEEDDRPNTPLVVVLSYQVWQRQFGGDPSVIGSTIEVHSNPTKIIGVMPPGFRFMDGSNDLWLPYALDRAGTDWRRQGRFIRVLARMKPGVSIDAARADIQMIASNLALTYSYNKNTSANVATVRDAMTRDVHGALLVLYAAVAVLLSIAAFNVASLMIARGASRRQEIAIRASLGAQPLAIVRQLLVESVILSVVGGVLGIFLAHWILGALVAYAPPNLLRVPSLTVDSRVMAYAFGLSMFAGVIVGLVPAMLAVRAPVATTLRTGGSRVTQSPRIRQTLVACQVAMTVVLLCGAGLLVRTIIALSHVDPGFNRHDLLTMEVVVPGLRYNREQTIAFYNDAAAAIRQLPGVDSAAAASNLPVVGGTRGETFFHRFGTPERPLNERPIATIRVVSPDYFHTLRMPVLRGREFTDADNGNSAPGFVVNQAFVKAFLSDIDPLSARLQVSMQSDNPYEPIIGVVGDVNERSVRNSAEPTVFYNVSQLPNTRMVLLARTATARRVAPLVVAAIHRLDPNLVVAKLRTLDESFDESMARERVSALVSGGFALSGLLLAALGLYGLLAFLVTERTKEIGLRMALGAQLSQVTWAVVRDGLQLVAIGAAIGIALSLALLRSIGTLLFGVKANDVSTYAAVLALLCGVAAIAAFVPARRAARIDPMKALRYE